MPGGDIEILSLRAPRTDAAHVHLAADPEDDGAEGTAAQRHRGASGVVGGGAGRSARRVRPHPELPLLQRYPRDESSAPECQPADVATGHQHPEQRRLDLRLAVGADDVLPRTGGARAGALRDGRVHAALLPDHGEPRPGRGDHHAGGSRVHAGALHRCAHRARAGVRADRGQRAGEHGALLRFPRVAALAVCGCADAGDPGGALCGAAALPRCVVDQYLDGDERLLSRAAGRSRADSGDFRAAPPLRHQYAGTRAADDGDDREPGLPRGGGLCEAHRAERGTAGSM